MRSIVKVQKQKEKGFTLVELITVVAIVSLLVVYITIKLGSSNEDAKVALASTFILGNVPTVISSYKARHMNSCDGLGTLDATDNDAALREELISRGLVGTTPWNEEWTANYDDTNRLLRIIFPTSGMENPLVSSQDIVSNIWDAPQIDGLAMAANVTGITYVEATHGTRALAAVTTPAATNVAGFTTDPTVTGSIQVWYDCI